MRLHWFASRCRAGSTTKTKSMGGPVSRPRPEVNAGGDDAVVLDLVSLGQAKGLILTGIELFGVFPLMMGLSLARHHSLHRSVAQ